MFDGIDIVILPTHDIPSLLSLYTSGFGFLPIGESDVSGPSWQRLLNLPVAATRSVLLGKPGSAGGWIRLVEVPGLPPASPARRPDRVGPYALDFYLRDPDLVEDRLAAAGWAFRSSAVHYRLPGTDIPVRERMLEQPISGLLHAMVRYRPRGTRCILDDRPDVTASEVAAAVFVTDRFEPAVAFARDVLGGVVYFQGSFDGRAVERMLDLQPGEALVAALLRGRRSRNARLEFAKALPARTAVDADPVPRVIADCAVDDLDRLSEQLSNGQHGASTGVLDVDGVRRLGLASVYGAAFMFHERT